MAISCDSSLKGLTTCVLMTKFLLLLRLKKASVLSFHYPAASGFPHFYLANQRSRLEREYLHVMASLVKFSLCFEPVERRVFEFYSIFNVQRITKFET